MVNYAFINAQNFVVEIIESIDPTETQTDIDGTIVGGSVEAWQTFYENQTWHDNDICRLCGNDVAIGYTYDGTNFIAPIQPEPVEPTDEP
jgi:hypothetical protein